MRIRATLFSLSSALALSALVAAQTAPTAPTPVGDADIAGLLRDLENAAARQTAAERLLQVSPKQLVPLYEALDGNTASDALKKQLVDLLPKIHARLRPAGRKSDAQLEEGQGAQERIDDYTQFAKHNAAWDDLALDAFRSTGNGFSTRTSALLFKDAIGAGCNDPVVRYYYLTRGVSAHVIGQAEALPQLDRLASEIDASAYPPVRKFYLNLRFLLMATDDGSGLISKARRTEALDKALAQMPEMFQVQRAHATRKEAIGGITRAMIALDPKLTSEMAMQKVLAVLGKSIADPSRLHAITADGYIAMAWNARGDGFAGSVTQEGWKLFDERIALAREEAQQGWKADPTNADNPSEMIWVCIARGDDQPEMEKWYRRAMFADPDSLSACEGKMNYLFPKWHGSVAEVLAFGRECVKTGTAANRIPTILLSAHQDLCAYGTLPDAPTADDRERYYKQPEVWRDVESAYEKLLSDKTRLKTHRAEVLRDRAEYFDLAVTAWNTKAIVALADEYGEELDTSILPMPYLTSINLARGQLGLKALETVKPAAVPGK